ncbi:MAG TPA: heterodisulfide reductase-related iron-sulfur binding cluster, partial [Candidatus Kryptonia bacterium]|nr:heterodisulfide reductase-related iron-sulfur binding cluster [Candidatus Kryptonia bacterium]
GAMAEAIGLKINEGKFWDAGDLRTEVDRIFDICHSCRLCFKFCGSFPTLFDLLDKKTEERRSAHLAAHPELIEQAAQKRAAAAAAEPAPRDHHEERAEAFGDELPELQAHTSDLSSAEVDRVVDLCFQCKLCYPNCPYTPPHDFALDFPRLLLRWKAQRVRREGVALKTKLIRNTRLIGRIGSAQPGLSNWAMANALNRFAMEKSVGIHREKLLPRFHAETFPLWWSRRGPACVEAAQPLKDGIEQPTPLKVALFSTCLVDYHTPETGKAAVQVLEHNGVEVVFPSNQICCGMPFLDGGDVETTAEHARQNVEVLREWVARGYEVVIPSPSCSLMVREEYPQLRGDPSSAEVAAHSHDLAEYIFRIAREGRLKRDFKRRLGKIKYHVPCHIRVQNIGLRGRDILKVIADEVDAVQECSGHDGTWSMSAEHFKESLHWGKKLFAGMTPAAGEQCSGACTDCGLAALHIKQGSGQDAVHPVVALAWAYGYDVGEAEKLLTPKVG